MAHSYTEFDILYIQQMGFAHGVETGVILNEYGVRAVWNKWTDTEVEAYMTAREEGVAHYQKQKNITNSP
jgi:hypothetical protein